MKQMYKFLSIATSLLLMLASMPAQSAGAAGVRYAAENGTGNCSSWANACILQTALSGAVSGDEIWVKAGTHKPTSDTNRTISFQLKSGVAVYGGFAGTETYRSQRKPAANLTILSGDLLGDDGADFANNDENSYHVVTTGSGTDSSAILDGFTVTGGNANGSSPDHSGGGMYNLGGSPSLTNMIFNGNSASYGGGMANDASSPSLTKVTLSGNQADFGGGMFNEDSSPSLTKVTLSGNQVDYHGGGIYNEQSSPSLTNVTLSGNQANNDGGGMYNNNFSDPSLTNVTLNGNQATNGGGMYNWSNSSPSLTNVIIANSASGGDCVNGDGTSSLDAASANNLIEDAANACGLADLDNGNITGADPNLGALANYGGWTETHALLPGSPAIDAGTNSGCPGTDQRGVTRPQGSLCDIGAYEYTGIYYTKPTASGASNCSSWANACTLQEALSGAVPGDEIWVMAGTHIPTTSDPNPRKATFELKSGVTVYGGFAGTEISRDERDPAANPTILSGDLNEDDGADFANNGENSYHVVIGSGTDSSAILDGFTIKGGNANGSFPDDSGGGMYNNSGSPGLLNVSFIGNSASTGGGMYNLFNSPILTNVALSGNRAIDGGGMLNVVSDPTLMNVTFSGNQASGSGGGMYNWYSSSPSLTDVTLSGNSADSHGGGMFNYYSNPSLTNVTLSGNQATSRGGGMYNDGSSPSLTNVTLSGNQVDYHGGGMYNTGSSPSLTNVTLSGNQATIDGGGMYNDGSNPSLTNVTFSGNQASGSGGGIYNYGSNPSLTNVTLSGSTAINGGGMLNDGSDPSLTKVTLSGNQASGSGGGMYNFYSSSPSLTDVTLSGNSADSHGGGMFNYYSNPSLTNVTLSGNQAGTYGGGMINVYSSPTLTNVIIADSASGGDCVNDGGSLNASTNNLIEDADNACGLADGEDGNIIGSDPKLGPLGNYGGWTKTQALQPGSPAIDTGKNSGCPGTDQRGKPRPDDGDLNGTATCDIGAVEFQRAPIITRLRSQMKYDGWVLESGEFTNKGGTKNNLGKALLVGDNIADKQYRVILSFGTASIPDRAVITKVILKVKKAGVTGSNPMSTHNSLVVDIKKGKFSTLPTLQINDFQAKPGKFKAGKFPKTLYSGWYRSILFKGAHAYINVKGYTQLRLRFTLDDNNDNGADILKLYSGNAILANRPQLIVEYYVP